MVGEGARGPAGRIFSVVPNAFFVLSGSAFRGRMQPQRAALAHTKGGKTAVAPN